MTVLDSPLFVEEGDPRQEPLEALRPVSHRSALILVAIFLAEIAVVTTRFDSEIFAHQSNWWAKALVYMRYLPQGLVAIGAAALVFRSPRLHEFRRSDLTDLSPTPSALSRKSLYLAAHAATFLSFLALTHAIWEGGARESSLAIGWIVGWFLTGLLAMGFLLSIVLSPKNWLMIAKEHSRRIPWIVGFGAAVCAAGRWTGVFLVPLHDATFRAAAFLLELGFHDLTIDRATGLIGTSEFQVLIAPECSGYEGIGLIWVFLTVYLWIFRRDLRFPHALWLLPLGTLVIWLANVFRIAALVVIGSRVSSQVAMGGFHSQAGWLAFNAVALGLVALSRWTRIFASDTVVETVESQPVNSTTAYLSPLLALVASMMLTTSLTSGKGFDASYSLRVVAVGLALWFCRKSYNQERLVFTWQAFAAGILVFAFWTALESLQRIRMAVSDDATSEFLSSLSNLPKPLAVLWLFTRVLGSVATVPIAEELAFRGYIPRRMLASDFTTVAPGRFTALSFVLSSILFGIFHGRWLAGTLAGMVYALVYRRKGNLSEAMIAHATTNALIAAQVLTTGAWSLWL